MTAVPADTPRITPFLMFEGDAEQAMAFYTSLFDDAEVVDVTRYGPDEAGAEGTVKLATFALAGQRLMCERPVRRLVAAEPRCQLNLDEVARASGRLRPR